MAPDRSRADAPLPWRPWTPGVWPSASARWWPARRSSCPSTRPRCWSPRTLPPRPGRRRPSWAGSTSWPPAAPPRRSTRWWPTCSAISASPATAPTTTTRATRTSTRSSTRRLGIPISLAVLTMAVGRRLGVPLVGVGMPGHFLLRDQVDHDVFVDPFAGGACSTATGCAEVFHAVHGADAAFHPAYLAPVGPRLDPGPHAGQPAHHLHRPGRPGLGGGGARAAQPPARRRRARTAASWPRRLAASGRFGDAARQYDQAADLSGRLAGRRVPPQRRPPPGPAELRSAVSVWVVGFLVLAPHLRAPRRRTATRSGWPRAGPSPSSCGSTSSGCGVGWPTAARRASTGSTSPRSRCSPPSRAPRRVGRRGHRVGRRGARAAWSPSTGSRTAAWPRP